MAGVNYASILGDLLSAAASAKSNKAYQSQQKGLQDLISESYNNPRAVYNRDYSAMDNTFYKQLQAQNAAKGRSTDAYKMGLAREAQFQQFLNQYRNGLQNRYATNAQVQGVNSKYNSLSPWATMLGGIFADRINPKTGQRETNQATDYINNALGTGASTLYNYAFGPTPVKEGQPIFDMGGYTGTETNPDEYRYSGNFSDTAQQEYDAIYGQDTPYAEKDTYNPSYQSTADNNMTNNYGTDYLSGTGVSSAFNDWKF